MTEGATRWHQACLALELLGRAPETLKGLVVRARSGPARDAFLARLDGLPLPLQKIHPGIADEDLFGGVDLAATLASGRVVRQTGLIGAPCALVLTMGERCSNDLAARLAQLLDADRGHCLIVLDEGAEPDEACPAPLSERVAFHVDLDGLARNDLDTPRFDSVESTEIDDETAISMLTALAARFGIDSLRAPWLALMAARQHGLPGGLTQADIEVAAALVFPQRATQMPSELEEAPAEDPRPPVPDEPMPEKEGEQTDSLELPEELLIDAVKALLPDGVLDQLQMKTTATSASGSGGAGHRKKGNRRGRPLPSRPGRIDSRNRIDLVATLRAAAPWQTIRARAVPAKPGLHIRASDIRIRRFEERSDRLLIFTVDASGSAAMARLGEAKGAVELLLAEAYARRDHVALVAFRGDSADILLPPTRSLVQTKRRLAALPGGGGTPLAAGLKTALELGVTSRGKGLTPTLAVLTDGRANIALDGSANRAQASDDAEAMGKHLRALDLPAILLDTGNRPTPALRSLAGTMNAPYLPLPRADAQRISGAVSDALA